MKIEGGRFLKKDDASLCWEVVNDRIVRKKIAHDFRTVRKSALQLESAMGKVKTGVKRKHQVPDLTASSSGAPYLEMM